MRRQVLAFCMAIAACAPTPRVSPAPLTPPAALTTEQDHARLMRELGIETLREGRNGRDPSHPNYANYDEARANPFPDLPDPLVTNNGRRVVSARMWREVRRAELFELFDREVYGRAPSRTPDAGWRVTETLEETFDQERGVTRRMIGHVDNSAYPLISVDIEMNVTLPVDAQGPVPLVLQLGWLRPPAAFANRPPEPGPDWRAQILARGWGFAILNPSSVQADNGAGLTQGIIGLVNRGQPRRPDQWGALKAWAWGASRALDYFETDPAIDARRLAIQGHSRYGKAALVAMAYDERFATGFISSSGMGGANLHRRNWGEIVENVAGSSEYHWMAGNYIKYAGPLNAGDLPVDSHELIALVAPRPIFISAGAQEGDGWVDARGMFMASVAAGPVYRLLGARDLGTREFPPIETGLMEGDIAFRQHAGGHTPTPNWPVFLDFAAQRFASQPLR